MAIDLTTDCNEHLGLADRLKARTADLHREAERTGIIADLLRGRASLDSYGLLLRGLLPVYETMERRLEAMRPGSPAAGLALPAIFRATALRADLESLGGAGASRTLPVVPAAQRYVDAVERAAAGQGVLLIAHAYTRYLGDLNGGQILGRLLAKRLHLTAASLAFYRFAEVADPAATAADLRARIDEAPVPAENMEPLLEEAALAFRLNIDLSRSIAEGA